MNAAVYASARVACAVAIQAVSPFDTTPTRVCTPSTVDKTGPPESPKQGSDGAGTIVNAASATVAILAVPCSLPGLSPGLAASVVPKPTVSTEAPTAAPSSGVVVNGMTGA